MCGGRGVRILVLGNGAAGAEKQALALGSRLRISLRRALALPISNGHTSSKQGTDEIKVMHVPLRGGVVYQKLPPAMQLLAARLLRDPFFGYDVTEEQRRILLGEGEEKSLQRVVIGCGRTTVALCAALKQPWASAAVTAGASQSVFNIQIQHPRVALRLFDAVITPSHDFSPRATTKLPSNIHLTLGTVCSIDQNVLKQEGDAWQTALEPYVKNTRARVAWLIGGPCRGFPFSEANATEMTEQVLQLIKAYRPHACLLVTFSRRTPSKVQDIIRKQLNAELRDSNELFVWSGEGGNPFEAMLHHATTIVTTPDSISMTTEAIATGKPVLIACADQITGKFKRFHDNLIKNGYAIAMSPKSDGKLSNKRLSAPSNGRAAIETELERISKRLVEQILRK